MKIGVSGTKQEKVDVIVDAREAAKKVAEQILSLHGMPPDCFVSYDKIVTWTHGSETTTVIVDNPTLRQLEIVNVCNMFRDLAAGLK